MVHPKPQDPERRAILGYLVDRLDDLDKGYLPGLVQAFEAFKANPAEYVGQVPQVNMQKLTSFPLTKDQWKALALNGSFNDVRMNLNTFARHGVFEDEEVVRKLAAKLMSPDEVHRARVFPFQIYTSFQFVNDKVPRITSGSVAGGS